MLQFIKFYFTSSMLNMFRTLINPSSGACDHSIVSPHWLCVLVSMCVGVSVWLGWSGICVAGWSTLIYPSSEACDYSVELPHWSYCSCFDVCCSFVVAGLEWYPCGWLKHNLLSQAPDDPSACHTDTTPNQTHWNPNTHRNKNTRPMWWYNRKVAGSWWWMY